MPSLLEMATAGDVHRICCSSKNFDNLLREYIADRSKSSNNPQNEESGSNGALEIYR